LGYIALGALVAALFFHEGFFVLFADGGRIEPTQRPLLPRYLQRVGCLARLPVAVGHNSNAGVHREHLAHAIHLFYCR
jgi:hypothetical protein